MVEKIKDLLCHSKPHNIAFTIVFGIIVTAELVWMAAIAPLALVGLISFVGIAIGAIFGLIKFVAWAQTKCQ